MNGVTEKRCFTTQQAYAYLGLKRRSFDLYIAPLLEGKAIRIGVSRLYERCDLDRAWDE